MSCSPASPDSGPRPLDRPTHTSGERLRTLTDYLDLDLAWLVRRCAELGEYGSRGTAQPAREPPAVHRRHRTSELQLR